MRECDTPYCHRMVSGSSTNRESQGHLFCDKCKATHSYRVLIAQVEHDLPVREIILDAAIFKRAGAMADYIGVSFVTIYHWIKRYFNLPFQEFRRQYICKSDKCYLLDIRRSSYSRHDYVLKKLRSKRYCACLNALEQHFIMTNAPVSVVQSILRGRPRIEQISDTRFALAPSPLYFSTQSPIYFDLRLKKRRKVEMPEYSQDGKLTAPKKKKGRPVEGPVFTEKVLMALHKMGGSARVSDLVLQITLATGAGHPRKNNTRREVYQNPDLLQFHPNDKKIMQLTPPGQAKAQELLTKYS